jgi:alkylation response protein AidB-like acyl-CoA dehydrogenase
MELALEYGSVRKTFGLPLNEHQVLAFRFAQMSARTEAAGFVPSRSRH